MLKPLILKTMSLVRVSDVAVWSLGFEQETCWLAVKSVAEMANFYSHSFLEVDVKFIFTFLKSVTIS